MKTACYALLVFLLAGCRRNEGIPADTDCILNLKQLEVAKEQWAIENHKTTNDVATMTEVTPFLHGFHSCRSGGVYVLGRVGEKPRCNIEGHQLP